VAGSTSGTPVSSEKQLPCFQHSMCFVSASTSPSLSDTSAWLHVSPMA
jgi:hypothetical protein